MDIEKLIEQLRKSADFEDYPIVASFAAIIEKKYLRDAATALSTLQAENEKLRAELERVKRERDAAIEWIQQFTETIGRPCVACKHDNEQEMETYCEGCGSMGAPSCKWEWRGIKED